MQDRAIVAIGEWQLEKSEGIKPNGTTLNKK